MTYTITIHEPENIRKIEAEADTNLLGFLRDASIVLDTPCAGSGTCGKCRIKVSGGQPAEGRELALLGEQAASEGYRLACYIYIQSDLDIYPDTPKADSKILTDIAEARFGLDAVVSKREAQLKKPDLNDQRDDVRRVMDAGGIAPPLELKQLRGIPDIVRAHDFSVRFIDFNGEWIGIEPGDRTDACYGAAFDIGTTTIAAYLFDLNTGERKAVHACLNPQRRFGADVISRIHHAGEEQDGLKELNDLIISCINDTLDVLIETAEIATDMIYGAVFAGNTTMMHLLMGLNPTAIAVAPFIPATTAMHRIDPADIGIKINEQGAAVVLPCVSAYVGADTVAAVLSCGMTENEDVALMVDIGTNAEIVLGNKDSLTACSVAAGPAFEGARIRCGVGGITGAVDTVDFSGGISYTTIDQAPAIGICGSGLVDAAAGMLDSGILDPTGRLNEPDELPEETAKQYDGRLITIDDERAFLIAGEDEAEKAVYLTQRDIRELQNAKAAIAGGIVTLLKETGLSLEDVKTVYLAGGFGNYINAEHAARIGLLPEALKEKTRSAGNAAGSGASAALLSKAALKAFNQMTSEIDYIELSSHPGFTEAYVDAMMFPED